MAVVMGRRRFEALVDVAIGQIPGECLALVENCVLMIEDEPDRDDPDLFGFYEGTPLSDRSWEYSGVLPDRIVIFRGPILRACRDEDEVVSEVRITVWHEIAHFFGIDDERLDELGYG